MNSPAPAVPDEGEALAACPFCGSSAQLSSAGTPIAYNVPYGKAWLPGLCRVHCSNGFLLGGPCSAVGPMGQSPAEAIAAWNTRAPSAEIARLTAALGEADIDYEVWQAVAFGDGDAMVAGSTSLADAMHYAEMYGQDGPAWVVEVSRRRITNRPAGGPSHE